MTTDRELIEQAAKAMGRTVIGWVTFGEGGRAVVAKLDDGTDFAPLHVNPMTDCMGDALRLAVRLNLTVGEHLGARHAGVPPCPDDFEDGRFPVRIAQADGADSCAATRRAITRAAAAPAQPAQQALEF